MVLWFWSPIHTQFCWAYACVSKRVKIAGKYTKSRSFVWCFAWNYIVKRYYQVITRARPFENTFFRSVSLLYSLFSIFSLFYHYALFSLFNFLYPLFHVFVSTIFFFPHNINIELKEYLVLLVEAIKQCIQMLCA